jgi:hypothetical protein
MPTVPVARMLAPLTFSTGLSSGVHIVVIEDMTAKSSAHNLKWLECLQSWQH